MPEDLISDAFCETSWSREGNEKGFQSKMELEDIKWKKSHTCILRRTEPKDW